MKVDYDMAILGVSLGSSPHLVQNAPEQGIGTELPASCGHTTDHLFAQVGGVGWDGTGNYSEEVLFVSKERRKKKEERNKLNDTTGEAKLTIAPSSNQHMLLSNKYPSLTRGELWLG